LTFARRKVDVLKSEFLQAEIVHAVKQAENELDSLAG
jgi:hypothetical protein